MTVAVVADKDYAPVDQLFLNQQEDVLRNDGFVVAIHRMLRDGAAIFYACLRQKVRGVDPLKERITDVFFVADHGVH